MKSFAIVVALAALAAGCAQPAQMSAMIAPVTSQTILPENSPLRNNVAVHIVTGGKETSPMWMSQVSTDDFQEALKLSLRQHTILGAFDAPLRIEANLIDLDQPIMGFDMTVTAHARYIVRTEDGETAFDRTFVSPFTADFSSNFLGAERLRLANEGAVKKSIAEFISALVKDAAADPTRYGAPPAADPAPAPGSAAQTS